MHDIKKIRPHHRLAEIVVIGSLVVLPLGISAAPAFADTVGAVNHSAFYGDYQDHGRRGDDGHGHRNWNNNQWNNNQWNQYQAPSNPFGSWGSL